MAPGSSHSPSPAVRRIVACERCGGRQRTIFDSAQGVRGLCIGCGADVAFPFLTEQLPMVVGRAGQVLAAS